MEASAELPRERLQCWKLGSEIKARRPCRINEQRRDGVGLRSNQIHVSFRTVAVEGSFRKQRASAKPAASSETISRIRFRM